MDVNLELLRRIDRSGLAAYSLQAKYSSNGERGDMPGSRVPSVEKILQEVYGDIEEYSRSKNRGNMDRSKRSSRRRTDSRYRSG